MRPDNPFAKTLQDSEMPSPSQGGQGQQAPQAPQGAGLPQGMAAQRPGMVPNVEKSDLQEGIIMGVTPSIIQAINALNNVVKSSQDKDTIQTMRSIISLLSRFVQEDQDAQSNQY